MERMTWRCAPVLAAALLLAGCNPVGPTRGESGLTAHHDDHKDTGGGSAGGDGSSGDDTPTDNRPPIRASFAISASAVAPDVTRGEPATGPYELYLWMTCTTDTVGYLQADVVLEGDALFADHWFSPTGETVAVLGEGGGDLNLTLTSCPSELTLVGTFHLEGSGHGGRLHIQETEPGFGVLGCDGILGGDFSCEGYASDGGSPEVYQWGEGCSSGLGANSLSLSFSATSPSESVAPVTDGLVQLFLWSRSGAFSALQGDLELLGGVSSFGATFVPEPPFLGLATEDGPDVLIAAGGCPSGGMLLGSFYFQGDGTPGLIRFGTGPHGGAATCDPLHPVRVGFTCTPARLEGMPLP